MPDLSPSGSEFLVAARYYYIRLRTGECDAKEAVPKIRSILKRIGMDSGALSAGGTLTSAEIDRDLEAFLNGTKRVTPRNS